MYINARWKFKIMAPCMGKLRDTVKTKIIYEEGKERPNGVNPSLASEKLYEGMILYSDEMTNELVSVWGWTHYHMMMNGMDMQYKLNKKNVQDLTHISLMLDAFTYIMTFT